MKYFSAAVCIAAALSLTACSTGTGTDSDRETGESTTLTVFAAASLSEVFPDIAEEFNKTDPTIDVKFSFAGSSDLAAQISEGAPADVIATADEKTMGSLEQDEVLASDPQVFASNTLTLAVPKGNPEHITGAKDLAGEDLVICAPQVPCGGATKKWAGQNDVKLDPVSEEHSVTDVLGKVGAGQADAGIVYVTDVARANQDVDQVDLAGADRAINLYPAAMVKASENQDNADSFLEFLQTPSAEGLLEDAGFETP